MLAAAQAHFGRPVSTVVNNALADFAFNADARAQADSIGWEDFQAQIAGSARGALNTTQAALPGMREQGLGRIINIGTNLFQNPVVPCHDYTAAKAALLSLTRTLAGDLGPHGITVNMLSGGLLRTTDASAATPEAVFDCIAANTPPAQRDQPGRVRRCRTVLRQPLGTGGDRTESGDGRRSGPPWRLWPATKNRPFGRFFVVSMLLGRGRAAAVTAAAGTTLPRCRRCDGPAQTLQQRRPPGTHQPQGQCAAQATLQARCALAHHHGQADQRSGGNDGVLPGQGGVHAQPQPSARAPW